MSVSDWSAASAGGGGSVTDAAGSTADAPAAGGVRVDGLHRRGRAGPCPAVVAAVPVGRFGHGPLQHQLERGVCLVEVRQVERRQPFGKPFGKSQRQPLCKPHVRQSLCQPLLHQPQQQWQGSIIMVRMGLQIHL